LTLAEIDDGDVADVIALWRRAGPSIPSVATGGTAARSCRRRKTARPWHPENFS
jgi:hypothetical protein